MSIHQSPSADEVALLWKSTPLAIRHSLFAETALLSLKVCDKAVGSGHFLLRAAHRIARHLARVRSGEEEPSPSVYRTALRDVIGHCLYGVDINPMAVELCKVTLWLEALEPGKPLSFLDHHIRCGNSLLGTTPELISAGLPDDTFEAIEGDDKAACASLKKLNRAQREGLRHLFIAEDTAIRERMHQAAAAIDEISDSRPEDIHRKEAAFRNAQQNYDFQKAWDLANLWCAAFVIKKHFLASADQTSDLRPPTSDVPTAPAETQAIMFGGTEEAPKPKAKGRKLSTLNYPPSTPPIGITTQHLRNFVEGGELPDGLLAEVERLADQYQFFHFHLAFPEVFAQGGFDVNLGNPPWDKVELLEREWFAARRPSIAQAQTAAKRKALIEALATDDQALYALYIHTLRETDGQRHFMRNSGRYRLCSSGRTNLYAIFAETGRSSVRKGGRIGLILPSGIATDDSTKLFFRDLLEKQQLVSFYDFENGRGIFPAVQGNVKFCLLTLASGGMDSFDVAAQLDEIDKLQTPTSRYRLSLADIQRINPNTFNAPTFSSSKDADLNKFVYSRFGVFVLDSIPELNPWSICLRQGLFNMTSDSASFKTSEELAIAGHRLEGNQFIKENSVFVPLCEAKLVYQYDHRAATFSGTTEADRYRTHAGTCEVTTSQHDDAHFVVLPRYWVSKELVQREARGARWFLVFRDIISAVADSRSLVASIVPSWGIGNTLPIVELRDARENAAILLGYLNTFVADYLMRQKASGSHLNFYIFKQLPVASPSDFVEKCCWSAGQQLLRDWLLPRVLELTYTAWDLESFAQDCLDEANSEWGLANGAEGYIGYWQRYSRHSPFALHHSPPPFRWDEERRFLLRCELDAAFFHLYLGTEQEWRESGTPVRISASPSLRVSESPLLAAFPTPRAAVAYILDTFPIVKRKDEAKFHGDYRTKRVILEIYAALAESMQNGKAYQTRLDPPPADPRCCHPPRKP